MSIKNTGLWNMDQTMVHFDNPIYTELITPLVNQGFGSQTLGSQEKALQLLYVYLQPVRKFLCLSYLRNAPVKCPAALEGHSLFQTMFLLLLMLMGG
jgi:hypothetical protein